MSARKLALTTDTPHSTAFSYFFPLALQQKSQSGNYLKFLELMN
jgi:hypothetical protein